MDKKKIGEKDLLKKKIGFFGFSVMELVVGLIVVAVLAGVSMPVLFKKSSKMKIGVLNSITTECDASNSTCSAFGSRCRVFKKKVENGQVVYTCAVCKASEVNNCRQQGSFFDSETCRCLSCLGFDSGVCPGCCSRCNRDFCTGCALGVGLKTRSVKMGCKICPKGTYSDTTKDEPCKNCSAGFYQPFVRKTSASDCLKCQKGHKCPTPGLGEQQNCTPGYWQDQEQQTSCKECQPGYKCPGETDVSMTPCEVGFYQSNYRQASCNKCTDFRANTTTGGIKSDSSSFCVCVQGKYLLNGVCADCAAGTYKTGIGNEKALCTECLAGSYNPNSGSVSMDACKQCDVGTYQDAKGKTACKSCGVGTYQNEKGKTNCKSCGVGTYQNETGKTACKSCGAGTYQDETGKNSCKSCGAGTYQNETGKTSCKSCGVGTYQNETGKNSCKSCGAGTYQDEKGKTACKSCGAGTYQDEKGKTGCKSCNGCSKCDNKTGACSECKNGYFLSKNATCITGQEKCDEIAGAGNSLFINNKCFAKYNVGDSSAFPIAAGIDIITTSSEDYYVGQSDYTFCWPHRDPFPCAKIPFVGRAQLLLNVTIMDIVLVIGLFAHTMLVKHLAML